MKWWEVVAGCDGYYTPNRFKTEQEAEDYVEQVCQEQGDLHVSEGPYEVDTDSPWFWSSPR